MVDDLFTKEKVGPLIKVGAAAERLAEPGLSVEHAAGQLRGLAARGLVYASGQIGTGRTAHKLYSLPDLGVTKIMSMLTVDLGISKPGLLEWVSDWLYCWPPSHPCADERFPTQTHAAMSGIARGEEWVCRIDLFTHDRSGAEMACAYLYRDNAPAIIAWELDNGPLRPVGQPESFEESKQHQFRLSITIPVTGPLSRLLSDPDKAN